MCPNHYFNPGGKYDQLCTLVREAADAESAIVIVVNGKLGSGFSVQATEDVLARLPDTLEHVAKAIREGQA